MEKTLNIGFTIKAIINAISLSAFNEPEGQKFYGANKKKLQRMENLNIDNMSEKDFSNYKNFLSRFDSWSEWAKKKGYLKNFQQTAMTDFYLTMLDAAKYNMPLDKNMTEHFFCYALAKVLYSHLQQYMSIEKPSATKYEALYYTLARFDFFGTDDRYQKDFSPIASIFALLNSWVKDINALIKYWEDRIAELGKRDVPPNLKSYISKWGKGATPSWNIVKLFFDNDLCPPDDYFIDDDEIKKDIYNTFKSHLFMSFVLTNLFDYLEREKIVSKEMRSMIRNGARLYYREFYIVRNQNDKEYSPNFENEAKDNLMFRTLFCMLDGDGGKSETIEFLDKVYRNPNIPILLNI